MSTETQTREQTCEQRIDGELSRIVETLTRLYNCLDAVAYDELTDEDISEALNIRAEDLTDEDRQDLDNIRERAQEQIDSMPLSVSVKRVMTVQLSYGGPSDEFEAEIGADRRLESDVVYKFKDWFDGAQRVTKAAAVERFVENFAEIVSLEGE